MTMIRKLDSTQDDFQETLDALLAFEAETDDAIEGAVAKIIADVRARGDEAVLEYTNRFDRTKAASMADFDITQPELDAALASLPDAQRAALQTAAERIRVFHERQKQELQGFTYTEADGTILGQRITPLDRVGIYVPGGKAAYPSSVLMNAVPAKVAGVQEIIMVVPTPDGVKNQMVLAAAAIAGVTRVIGIGGAQAVAALAHGTETIQPVDKIVGPGNAYVAAAKRLVFGDVGIDSIAGPTELVVGADDSVDPSWVAADLLAQAEHDPVAVPILIARGADFAGRVAAEVERQVALLPRREIAEQALRGQGAVFVVDSDTEMADAINRLAPEHAELAVRDARKLAARITTAGALFLGSHTPEPVGDYIAGPSHVLPTGGSARFSGPLSVADFVKRTSIIEYDAPALDAQSDHITALTAVEGLDAHGRAVTIRTRR